MKKILLIICLIACSCRVAESSTDEEDYAELNGVTHIVKVGCMPTPFQQVLDSLWDEQYIEDFRADRLSKACQTLESEGINACECQEVLANLGRKAQRTSKEIDRMVRGIPYKFRR